MQVGVGFSDNPDSREAGRQAVKEALNKTGRTDICSLVLLFNTARHDQQLLREAVALGTGNANHIYGGGAVGIITNEVFGYAGDQVGVVCIWLDGSECDVLVEKGLDQSEIETGKRLGSRMAELGVGSDSPVLLFYDAIEHMEDGVRLLMATWLLEGIEKSLGHFPDITGAGMQGDHICSPTKQYTGAGLDEYVAMSLLFSDDICMDSVIMHGCRPASPYYTVTRAEGSMILEINGKPAIDFLDGLLGSAIKPESYPFFLLFGVHRGEHWEEYDENAYASRLCQGIDKERGGIIMFEPDMVTGTEFQLMFRSLELDYMKPKIDSLFSRLGGREPLFALYIDCAGRCAGYGGVDLEDAYVIQKAVGNRIPLLGLYTGVEIASIRGVPQGLDWTGVFIIFTKQHEGNRKKAQTVIPAQYKKNPVSETEVDEMAAMIRLCEYNAAKVLALDAQSIQIRHELEQKRRGFQLLAELSVSLRQDKLDSLFQMVTLRINAALNMQRTIVLIPDQDDRFVPSILQGYTAEEQNRIAGIKITVDAELMNPEQLVIVTGADPQERFQDVRKALNLPYFISSPVVVRDEVEAILITGRMMEATPFLSRLGVSDAETVQAISGLLASVLVYQKLDDANRMAQLDGLTGILNRGGLENGCLRLWKQSPDHAFAFMIIDFDHFKDVNDTYGHMAGDAALKCLAQMLRRNFRSTDLVARVGGDEFAVFYAFNGEIEQAARKAAGLIATWAHTPVILENGYELYASLSIGISVAPKDGVTYSDLFRKADHALYKAKEEGRSQYAIYDEQTMNTIL